MPETSNPSFKFQACTYQTDPDSPTRRGIACLTDAFDCADVQWIVDAETGKKIPEVWDYTLYNTPLCRIDFLYAG
jgi:hypothetical protein